jgi:putative membrane protein
MKNANWVVAAILGILFLAAILTGAIFLGNQNNRGWGIMGPGMMNGWGFGLFGWVGMILMWLIPVGILSLVILGIAWLVRSMTSGDRRATPQSRTEEQSTPREILQARYARGEITREQYLEMLNDLN